MTWLDLRPTIDQYKAFAEHLCDAHSWYKHLPLLEGRKFVVFINLSAGTGQRIIIPDENNPETFTMQIPPEGDNYTDENPRLHYAWKTTQEYRKKFGFLHYIDYDENTDNILNDENIISRLPSTLIERCSFTLYPYVSAGYFHEAVHYECHQDAIDQIRNGFNHPCQEQVLRFKDISSVMYDLEEEMNSGEQKWVLEYNELDGEGEIEHPSTRTNMYAKLSEESNSLIKFFYQQEINKIKQALKELDEWLQKTVS